MSASQPYRVYHPRWYRARMSTWWWLGRPSYVAFILREVSCVFVAWTVVFLLLLIRAIGSGPRDYTGFLEWAGTPWVVVLNVVALAFLLYHAVTWFQLTPKAMAVRLRGRRVPDAVIIASAYMGWVVVSGLVAWFVLRG
jgi:fumarate reductase subunit C